MKRKLDNLPKPTKNTDVLHNYQTRRAQVKDIEAIRRLFTHNTYRLFGCVDMEELLHLCFMTLVLEENKEIVGAICVNNYPNIPSIPPWSWKNWLRIKYRMDSVNPRNSLWVHLTVYHPEHEFTFLKPLLKVLFSKCPYVQYIFFVIPPHTYMMKWLQKHAMQITPLGYSDPKMVQTLYAFVRQHYVLTYKIRQAVPEDNDDLVPLIDSHSTRLKEMYGEYYVAELILNKDVHGNRHLIVAEYNGVAVAVLCLNKKLNYEMVNDCFQLTPFNGLKKPSSKDELNLDFDSVHSLVRKKSDSLTSLVLVSAEEGSITTHSLKSESRESSKIDLNAVLESMSIDLELEFNLAEETLEEEEEEKHEDENMLRGHAYPNVSYDVLEFTEKQLHMWKKAKRRSTKFVPEDIITMPSAIFHGGNNAFTLEIAAAKNEHEFALNLLLEAAFELFPRREYCVMCMPTQHYTFPLASKIFSRVAPKPESDFAQELFIIHHNAISGYMHARKARRSDKEPVEKLLKTITKGQSALNTFYQCLTSAYSEMEVYIMLCDMNIIGMAILAEVEDLEYITSHYQLTTYTDISKHKPGTHGLIKYFVLSPIFQRHTRFFLLELHRLSDYSMLYYIIHPHDIEDNSTRTLACVLGDLMPVIPAKMPEYSNTESSSWCLPEAVGRVERPYAVYISTPVYCSLSRQEINDKIIVVGASDAGIAFLVSLIFYNKLDIRVNFNNIILVSTHGLTPYRTNRFRDIMKPTTGEVSGYYLSLLSLPTYVTVIAGVMSAIDRKNKTILVNGSSLNYDKLFLMCGKQYQMPKRSEDKRGRVVERPNNVFIVNTEMDVDIAITNLKALVKDDLTGFVIVYGSNIEAYCCLEAITELGIPNSRIYFVQPPPTTDEPHTTIFNDDDVEDTVNEMVRRLGIQMYTDYKFIDWTFDHHNHNIASILFESKTRLLHIECLGVFMYEEKKISTNTVKAIINANLTFDGGVVIDTNSCTNDPNIYAAGTITKYSRRYYADHMKQGLFNQTEIGHKLGQQILKQMTNCDSEAQNFFATCQGEDKVLVPRYTSPLMVHARLPGKINYMCVKKPGLEVPLDVAMTADDYGQVFTSGDCGDIERQGYFRLHLNNYNMVETITCLTKQELEKVNVTHLWGKHENLLNNLVKRFEMVTITDLFSFFSQPWSYAIYHDRFEKLNDDITDILTLLTDEEGTAILEDVIQKLDDGKWKKLKEEDFDNMEEKFADSDYQKKVEEKVLEFLVDNYNYLPMYANPTAINVILAGCEVSPMFKNI